MPLRGPGTLEGLFSVVGAPGDPGWSGTVTLTEDVHASEIVIPNSTTIICNGFGIFSYGDIVIGDSVLILDAAVGSKDGIAGAGGTGGQAGTNAPAGTHGGSWYSAGAGAIATGTSATVLAPSAGIHIGGGGGGGSGGASHGGGVGGLGGFDGGNGGAAGGGNGDPGTLVHPRLFGNISAITGEGLTLYNLMSGCVNVLGVLHPIYGGNGGGGGGGNGVANEGGGGGAGGGVIRMLGRNIRRSGSGTAPIISVAGGNGGNGGGFANCGGGGGGGAGAIMLGYGKLDPSIVLNIDGGTGGAGSTAGTGGAGGQGRIFKWEF